jgi:hypothetical protein
MLISLILVCGFSAAAEWLQLKKRRGSPLSERMERQDVIAMLEHFFLETDVKVLAAWADAEDLSLPQTVRKTAEQFSRGFLLAQWVGKQNESPGCAVPSQLLVEKCNASSGAFPALGPVTSTTLSSGRSWATRWRADFGGKHGKPPMEEPVPLEERRSKAMRHNLRFGPLSVSRLTSICDPRGPKIKQIFGPKMGSIFWTLFWGRLS